MHELKYLLISQFKLPGENGELVGKRTKLLQPLATGSGSLKRSNPHTDTAIPLKHPFRFEPGIGLGNGHQVHLEILGHLANAGDQLPFGQAAAGYQRPQLIHQLAVDGDSRCGVNLELQWQTRFHFVPSVDPGRV